MKRREFVGTCSLGIGALSISPLLSSIANSSDTELVEKSALNTKIRVKFVFNGVIHEDAWEGSCRTGDLSKLTYEAEKRNLDNRYNKFLEELKTLNFPPEVELLKPVKTYLWVEKGNPYIMYEEKHLAKLKADDPKTDVYVITNSAGLPNVAGFKIAERYKKPVILVNTPGWGVDMPAAIRSKGLEGYYVQNWEQLNVLLYLMFVRKAIHNTKILNATNFPNERSSVKSSIIDMDFVKERYGIGNHFVDYKEFFSEMDIIEKDKNLNEKAAHIADKLMKNSLKNNMTKEDVINSLQFYQTTKRLLKKYSCNAFTIDCFELCSSLNTWNRRFTPCLTHALLKDIGFPSACEGDINVLLAIMVLEYLSKKAVYMGNPDINTKENTLTVHHSVASLKMNGINQPETPYEMHTFTRSGFGVTLRHDFRNNQGREMTIARFNPQATKILITKGKIIDGGLDGYGCAQRVVLKIPNGRDFLRKQQDFGHHLALVYGNYVQEIDELSDLINLEVVPILH